MQPENETNEPAQMLRFIRRDIEALHREMDTFMNPGEHYEMHPGTKNPRINKRGMEAMTSRLGLQITYTEKLTYDEQHLTAVVHVFGATADGESIGSGIGLCSTMEDRYANRVAGRICPRCGTEAIIKSKPPKKGYWCNRYKGGCGANYNEGDEQIEGQETGKVPNDALPDQYHTVLAMASKRAEEDMMKKAFDVGGYVAARADLIPVPSRDNGNRQQERRQAPPRQDAGVVTNPRAGAPTNHDEPRHGSPAGEDMSPGEILTNMQNELKELRDDGAALGKALARYARCWERMPDEPAKTAHTMWQKYEGIRKSLEAHQSA